MSSAHSDPESCPEVSALPGIARLIGEEAGIEVIQDLYLLFLEETDACLAAIEAAASARDTGSLALYLHRLQGSASSVGADELAALGKTLERAARAERLDAVLSCLPALAEVWSSLRRAVERDVQRFAPR